MPHEKPTEEELEKGIKEAEDLSTEDLNTPEPGEEESNDKSEEKEEVENPEEKEEEKEEEGEDEEKEEKEEVTKERDTLKKRYSDSTREAQILAAKQKKNQEAVEKAATLPEPTEAELRIEYPEWDEMTDTEKKLATKTLHNDKKFAIVQEAANEGKDIDDWNAKVDEFIDDPANIANNPKLDGKEEEFKIFANKPTHRGVDFSVLITSFLYSVDQEKPVSKKGSMFPTGNGGPKDAPKPKSNKLTLAEAEVLKNTNFKLYKEKLTAGLIEEFQG